MKKYQGLKTKIKKLENKNLRRKSLELVSKEFRSEFYTGSYKVQF